MSWAIWITGRPGSGKTTLAGRVADALRDWPVAVAVLDVARARRAMVGRDWVAGAEEEMVHRAVAYAATLLTRAGVAVVIDATAPRRAWRDEAREWITHFAEVQLICPPEVCVERERAARWQPAGGAPEAAPDLALDYEESLHPELRLHTHVPGLVSAVEEVLRLAARLHRAAAASVTPSERVMS